jgi:hypothetical protein
VATDLAALWQWFAETQCREYSPLYDSICRAVPDAPDVIEMIADAPPSAHLPNVLLAAVHYLLLGEPDHPLARIYAAADQDGAVGHSDAAALFIELCRSRRPEIEELLRTRHTNTNEVGRSALLGPALTTVASTLGAPLALVDVGCSAGLNLLCDRYRLDYGRAGSSGPADAPVDVACDLVGDRPPPISPTLPTIAARVGIDRDPVDVADEDKVRWQLACVWPDTGRLARTRVAFAEARRAELRIVDGDAVATIAGVVRDLPPDAPATVVTTWALAYLAKDQRLAFIDQLRLVGRERAVAWVSGEGAGVVPCFASVEPPVDSMGTTASLLGLVVFDGDDERSTLLGFGHPHGRWLEWRA